MPTKKNQYVKPMGKQARIPSGIKGIPGAVPNTYKPANGYDVMAGPAPTGKVPWNLASMYKVPNIGLNVGLDSHY